MPGALDSKFRDCGLSRSYDRVSDCVLFSAVSVFPLIFDNGILELWACGVRPPVREDVGSVDRYVALCASFGIKPFVSSFYDCSDGFRMIASHYSGGDLPVELRREALRLSLGRNLTHRVVLRNVGRLEFDDLKPFMKDRNYSIGLANLPFNLFDEMMRGYLRVVQQDFNRSGESHPSLELHAGNNDLTGRSSAANVCRWFNNLSELER